MFTGNMQYIVIDHMFPFFFLNGIKSKLKTNFPHWTLNWLETIAVKLTLTVNRLLSLFSSPGSKW